MINFGALQTACLNWQKNAPFPHFVVDNFFDDEVASKLEREFPDFEDDVWYKYGNAIEIKKVCNNWNVFAEQTYKTFTFLNSPKFLTDLGKLLFKKDVLHADFGLNGGGLHIHSAGGKLNTHLDYSLHPKVFLQRKLNVIVYLNSRWEEAWGGSLGLWSNESDKAPGDLVKQIAPVFNRAVIFDTTCNSWHGLPDPIECPNGQFRKSLAVYYLTEPDKNVDVRGKALFAPTEAQKNDKSVIELIAKRSSCATSSAVYRD